MKKNKKKLIIISAVMLIIILLDCWGFSMKTEYYTADSDKISSPVRIVFISDLHNCFYGGTDQSGLMNAIDDAKPDIVLFGGDIVDEMGGTKNAETILKMVSEAYPCAYTCGNHEIKRKDTDDIFKLIKQTGVPVLHGNSLDLDVNGQKIHITGAVEPATDSSQIERACMETTPDSYNILLGHEPQYFYNYFTDEPEQTKNFDLLLSGHDHGGQWRLPFVLDQGLYAPDQGLFPDFTGGQRSVNNSVQIVSRGLARQAYMLVVPRIFNRPELSVIDIT